MDEKAQPQRFDMEQEFWALSGRCDNYTMTSIERRYALWRAVRYVVRNRIPGDLVECGVWRGGSSMMAAFTFLTEGDSSRTLWLYDTFEGMTAPTGRDIHIQSGQSARKLLDRQDPLPGSHIWGIAALDEVKRNMRSTGYPAEKLVFRKGPVEETLRDAKPHAVSILRLDTDWYESTLVELHQLWPKLVRSGVLIIDDYGWWKGQRDAVDEFFGSMQPSPYLSRVDVAGAIVIKP